MCSPAWGDWVHATAGCTSALAIRQWQAGQTSGYANWTPICGLRQSFDAVWQLVQNTAGVVHTQAATAPSNPCAAAAPTCCFGRAQRRLIVPRQRAQHRRRALSKAGGSMGGVRAADLGARHALHAGTG